MLNTRHLKTRHPIHKFDHKIVNPFYILNIISPTVIRLNLPKKWRIYNSFYVSLLKPYRTGLQEIPNPDQIIQDTEPVKTKNYKINKIKDSIYAEGDIIKYWIK